MINKSEQITNLAAALLKVQKEIGSAVKGAENPFFRSMYADLGSVIQAVKEPLNNNGITFLQAVDRADIEGIPVVDTILLHESGQYLSTRTPVYCNKPNDPQAFGSGITYAKRYALQALLGLPTADDDGEAAMARNGKKSTKKPQPKPEQDVKAMVDQAFFNYQTENTDVLQKDFAGNIFDASKFKAELKRLHKELPLKDKKIFKWNADTIKELAGKLKVKDCTIKVK